VHETSHGTFQRFINNGLSVYKSLKIYNVKLKIYMFIKFQALFGGARKAKKELGYSFIWTGNGQIFLRKDKDSPVIHIRSKEDINNQA
jgi:hypothetical protein